ncbi:hypothetical protein E3N88_10202 [Mikania micrantha]|uniref:Uncharacterized protein n=1 Tax=Mikania micrantha TaxID=192012 RepID=A0A5N6P9U4_9ASTR|nr:hypothetical protein E3N88_10202 [Mikania micrantha]
MWWDGVWAGCRLDSGICPICKHTDLDITCGVNEIKVLPKEVMNMFKLRLLDFMLGVLDRGPKPSTPRGLRSNPAGSGCDSDLHSHDLRSRLLVSQCLPYSDSSMFTHAINLNIMLKLLAILEWTNWPLSACQGVFFVAMTIVDHTVWPLSACQKGVLHS